jgi:hypothetical protein
MAECFKLPSADRSVGTAVNDPNLDALLQRVEACRYRAKCIERDAADWAAHERGLAFDIASRWRLIAEQLSALAVDTELETAF